VVAPPRGLTLALSALLLTAGIGLSGCLADGSGSQGVVVTSQPLLDAFHVLDAEDELAGIPDWAIVDQPHEADRVGRPFVVDAERVVRLEPDLVLDQPHPLVSGPSREALASGVQQAGVDHTSVPAEPRLSTIERVLAAAGEATGTDHEAAWDEVQADLAELTETVPDGERPNTLFLFPAGLVAGANTDAGLVLELAGLTNAGADAGLEGYTQISSEAVQRSDVDLVVATATMHQTPAEIAANSMFEDTPIEDTPQRVLVVDPSRTTTLGPHVAQAATHVAQWAHDELPGPRLSPVVDPWEAHACQPIEVRTQAANATVELLGETHDPGTIRVPDVPEGHYRVTVTATDGTGTATIPTLLTVEGSDCD
jgi:ABC-type hemin transport system substrate-binding protein